MDDKTVLDELVACTDKSGDLDTGKFFSRNPKTTALTLVLRRLSKKGYVTYDLDDKGIVNDVDITEQFLLGPCGFKKHV